MRKAIRIIAISFAALILAPLLLLAVTLGSRKAYQYRHILKTQPTPRAGSNIAITLFRSGCFGSCPSYCVRIINNKVIFDGDWFIAAPGHHEAPVDEQAAQELTQKFLNSGFYRLKDEYFYNATDIPKYRLTINIDGKKMSVLDRWGEQVGMPKSVTELEKEVDRVAGTKRWIEAGDGIVPQLEQEHFNFRSPAAYWLLNAALEHGHLQTVQELIARGVPMQTPIENDKDQMIWRRRIGGLFAAAANGKNLQAIQLLITYGAKKDPEDLQTALHESVRNGSAEIVKILIKAGADPLHQEEPLIETAAESGDPDTVREILHYTKDVNAHNAKAGDSPAIFEAAISRNEPHNSKRLECVRVLLAAGADPNARDWENNKTLLHYVDSKEIAQVLIAAGANPHAKDKSGKEPDPSDWK